eukprot:jgi/Ulvmu1/5758/UM025_0012.1
MLSSVINGDAFVASFCTPDHYKNTFQNFLGGLTPCFCDVILLGSSHLMLLCLSLLRWSDLKPSRNRYRSVYSIKGPARAAHRLAVFTCVALALIPLMQFNARLAQTISSKQYLPIAPYEIVNFIASTLSFAAAGFAINTEINTFVPSATWLVRMPLVATFAAEVAKLRGVLIHIEAQTQNYFFWLFVVQAVLEAVLALWAVTIACPPKSMLDTSRELQSAYEMLPSSQLVMDIYDEEKVCPEATAGIFSSITFSWLNPLLRRGHKHALELKDLWQAAPGDRVDNLHTSFTRHWNEQQSSIGGGSLAVACWKTTARLFLVAAPYKILNDASQFVAPVFLNLLLSAIAAGAPVLRSYLLAVAMFVGLILGTICECQYWQRTMRAGFQLRALLIAEVYRKIMFLTAGSRTAYSRGFIYNIVTNDTDAVQLTCNQIFSLISSPLRIVVAMVLLYAQLGAAAFAALALLICMIPAQAALASLSTKILREGMEVADERTKLEADVITGIEAVKTQAWERPFITQITAIRSQELAVLWRSFKLQAGNTLLLQTIPTLVTIATFALYVLLGNDLTAAKAFTALSLFSVLRFPLFQLPMIIQQLTRAGVAFRRLSEFLMCPEQGKLPAAPAPAGGTVAARFVGDVSWGPGLKPVLSTVNFTAHRGELVMIVGATGSGKTALLYGLLGLTEHVHGNRVALKGSTAFVSQQAFIFGGTVQENILFEAPFHADDYDRAITAANLHADFEQLAAGDQTELGEGGVNVSGGQKQRIAVARAVYANADVYLFDDPLSALDAKVGRQVFRACIAGELASKTRLLVTNQLQYVPDADKVVVLRDGRVAEAGTYADLMTRKGGALAEMMQDVQTDIGAAEAAEAEETAKRTKSDRLNASPTHAGPRVPSAPPAPATAASGSLTAAETRATGVVSGAVLMAYARAMGGLPVFLQLITLYVLIEVLRNAASVWLGIWTAESDAVKAGGGGDAPPHPAVAEMLLRAVEAAVLAAHKAASSKALFYLAIFCAISFAQVLTAGITQFRLRYLSLRAADSLHSGMLRCLLRAPMSFFHANPSGRVTNRFTKDTSDIDRNLAFYAAMWFQSMLQLLSTAVVIGAITPFVLPVLVPLLLLFGMLYLYFQASVREIKRLDSVARSPIFTAVSNALTGLPTIRSFRREDTLRARTGALVDTSSVMQLASQSLNRWLSLRLEAVGAVVSFAAAALAIEQQGQAAWAGLTLSYALQMTSLTTMTVRLASMAENSFNAVERVDEFSRVEPEGGPADDDAPQPQSRMPSRMPSRVPSVAALADHAHTRSGSAGVPGANGADTDVSALESGHSAGYGGGEVSDEDESGGALELPAGFPRYGRIVFEDAQMRYRPGLPLVLKGLTFTVEPGSSVGVVGRTGAGKSSIINALFRLTELCGGSVRVDDFDISRARLADLRRAMALIPQHPTLFTGTLRANLAPEAAHVADDDLWSALRAAHLDETVASHPEGLEMRLVDNGAPLAQGQRQLVALARALLRRSRVLVLDEATANVDMETDALIQTTIHSEFDGCTRIAVAHRLHTVIDSDKILVMDAGVAAEYDTPAALLANNGGIFTSMVNETGKATAAFLRDVATGAADLAGPATAAAAAAAAAANGGGSAAADAEEAEAGLRRVSAAATPAVSRSGSTAQNGLLVAQKVLKEAAEADQLLRHLVTFMEDQAQTEHMERHFTTANSFAPAHQPAPAVQGATNVAVQLGKVAHLVCSVKGQLTTMRNHLEIPLSGFDVPAAQVADLPCREEPEAREPEALSAEGGSHAFRRFRRAVSQVQIMQRGTQMLRKGEGSMRVREQAESEAASFM